MQRRYNNITQDVKNAAASAYNSIVNQLSITTPAEQQTLGATFIKVGNISSNLGGPKIPPKTDIKFSYSNVDYKFEFREYYLSYFPSFGEISLGKKIHAWGAVDGNSPLDILNPTNFYYLFTDLDETKIGRESIVLNLFASDNIKIQLLAMPGHGIDFIPQNDPNFPIQLPAYPGANNFLDQSDLTIQ